ncbi:hypothetical protein AB0F91_28600 [Amycolatopsis sp. NPDC023774]|uniref:hypothetical protein n=1 Tax=Amycolatopsis sp. NPDC023774 TaxID=3155015 RepID=UPI0033F8A0D8
MINENVVTRAQRAASAGSSRRTAAGLRDDQQPREEAEGEQEVRVADDVLPGRPREFAQISVRQEAAAAGVRREDQDGRPGGADAGGQDDQRRSDQTQWCDQEIAKVRPSLPIRASRGRAPP